MRKNKPKLLKEHKDLINAKTDEELYKYGLYEGEDVDEEGNVVVYFNPKGQWDYYTFGGRWEDMLKTKDGEMVNDCKLNDLDLTEDEIFVPSAILYPDGTWKWPAVSVSSYEKGYDEARRAWYEQSINEIKKTNSNLEITIIDCHI